MSKGDSVTIGLTGMKSVVLALTFFEEDLINGFRPRGYDGFLSHSDNFCKTTVLAIICKYCHYLYSRKPPYKAGACVRRA